MLLMVRSAYPQEESRWQGASALSVLDALCTSETRGRLMKKHCLASLLAILASAAQAETLAAPVAIQPAVDTAEQRQALRKFTVCVAQARPGWARSTLA